MAPFDIPALTRGISGLFTAKEEGKRAAEDRAREQQSQAVVDRLREMRAEELQARGKRARERREAQAAERAAEKEQLEQGQRQRADFILTNLSAEDLEGIKGFESQALPDQLKTLETALRRQRTKTDRVPRRTTAPKPFAQDARVRRVVTEFNRRRTAGLKPETSQEMQARVIAGGDFASPPTDTTAVERQAMLDAVELFKHEFTEEELPELTTILDGIVGEDESSSEPSADDIKQMIRDLSAQGLSPEEIQANLAQQGINVRL